MCNIKIPHLPADPSTFMCPGVAYTAQRRSSHVSRHRNDVLMSCGNTFIHSSGTSPITLEATCNGIARPFRHSTHAKSLSRGTTYISRAPGNVASSSWRLAVWHCQARSRAPHVQPKTKTLRGNFCRRAGGSSTVGNPTCGRGSRRPPQGTLTCDRDHYVEIPAVQSQQQSPSVGNAKKKKVHIYAYTS